MIRETLLGAVAGLAATVPMTGAMLSAHRRLPWYERYPLPPRRITKSITKAVGLWDTMDQQQKSVATLLAHFGYGAAMGATFGAMTKGYSREKLTTKGLLFGPGVWAASYLGLLPALGILEPATRHPARRNALMIGAHIIWGLSLARVLRGMDAAVPAVKSRS